METFRVTGPLCGEFTGHRWISPQRPVTRSFDVFFDLRLNERLSEQSWSWWFETPLRSLWRHCNVSWHASPGSKPWVNCPFWAQAQAIRRLVKCWPNRPSGVSTMAPPEPPSGRRSTMYWRDFLAASAGPTPTTITHCGRDKMAAIYQTTFANAFSWMKMHLMISRHWFRQWLGADQATSHCLNQWWLVYWRI